LNEEVTVDVSKVTNSTADANAMPVATDEIPSTTGVEQLNYTIDDLFGSFNQENERFRDLTKPFPAPLSPLRTPVHEQTDGEETVLQLHPSPTPALEEAAPTTKVRSPIRAPESQGTNKTLQSPNRRQTLPATEKSAPRKENVKRASDGDDSRSKKKIKYTNSVSEASSKSKEDERPKFKIPLRPVQKNSNKAPDYRHRPTSSNYYQNRPAERQRSQSF